ncbi:MAG: TM2 domain-containing protein [Balneolaceae bacterium]
MNKKILKDFPDVEGDELAYLIALSSELSDEEYETFKPLYNARRRDPILILLSALAGFMGIAGVHRVLVGHIGFGILYFFTAGLCFIGTIVDSINYKNLAFEHNRSKAREILTLIR